MSLVEIIILAVAAVFFSLNIGGAVMAPAFGAALGAKIFKRSTALILFSASVIAGATLMDSAVAKTLSNGLVPATTLDSRTTTIVLAAAAGSLFLANVMRAPQSTTWVTVFAIVMVGLLRGNLMHKKFVYQMLPVWALLPLTCFALTSLTMRIFYPLRGWNYRLYEHLQKHELLMKVIVLFSSSYVAFGVGMNNVALVAAPLASAGVAPIKTTMAIVAPIVGLGALVFGKTAGTVSKQIVPIGLVSATICNLIVGTLIILATTAGIPQSVVQLGVGAVFGVALVKDGRSEMARHKTIWRIVLTRCCRFRL